MQRGPDGGSAKHRPTADATTTEPHDAHKFGLPFILNVPIRRGPRPSALAKTVVVAAPTDGGKAGSKAAARKKATSTASAVALSKEEKKRRRTCKHEGCHNYIVHKGLCCRHGVRRREVSWIGSTGLARLH
jgi:hypothetical protein